MTAIRSEMTTAPRALLSPGLTKGRCRSCAGGRLMLVWLRKYGRVRDATCDDCGGSLSPTMHYARGHWRFHSGYGELALREARRAAGLDS